MHELTVTQSILDICLHHAQKANAKRITVINIRLGDLTSYVDDSVVFYWGIIAKGTIAERATLHFDRIAAEMTCLDCGASFQPTDQNFTCPQCASIKVKVTKGTEMSVESIEVE